MQNEGSRKSLYFREQKYLLYPREKKTNGLFRRQTRPVWGRRPEMGWLRQEESKRILAKNKKGSRRIRGRK